MTQAAHDDYELPEGFKHCPKLTPVVEAVSALDRVKAIVRILNEPGGCPWDGEQTNKSLLKPLLEETYEYIDAVETNDRANMREELGDTLLQSIFQAQVCAHDDNDPFDIDEICNRLVDKEKQRTSVLEGISHAQGALPRTAKIVSRVAKSARHEQLEQAFEPETTGEHQYADAIITAIRAAHHNGVDIEADLRCRLRDIEHAIETIEKEHPND